MSAPACHTAGGEQATGNECTMLSELFAVHLLALFSVSSILLFGVGIVTPVLFRVLGH